MYPKSIKNLIESFKYFPGIGEKTAERLAFSVLTMEKEQVESLSKSILDAGNNIKRCKICNNLSEGDKYRVGAKLLGMNHLPCTFEQFIEDSYFLGNPQITNNGKSIFNIWKNVGKEIYPTSISTRTPYVSFGG